MLERGPDADGPMSVDLDRRIGDDDVGVLREGPVERADGRAVRVHVEIDDGGEVQIEAVRGQGRRDQVRPGSRRARRAGADRRLRCDCRKFVARAEAGHDAALLVDADDDPAVRRRGAQVFGQALDL